MNYFSNIFGAICGYIAIGLTFYWFDWKVGLISLLFWWSIDPRTK